MFKENRIPKTHSHENTSAGWGHHFRNSPPLSKVQEWKFRFSPEYRLIRKYLRSSIMDGGCGAGQWVEFLHRQGYQAHGVDYSADLIAMDKQRYPQSQWTAADIRNVPLPDGSFGGIVSWGVIEHDPAGPEAALKEFYRLLAPGACCIVTVPVDTPRQRMVGLMDNEKNEGEFFQYYFTPDELAERLKATGFEIMHSAIVPRTAIALAAPRLYFKYIGTRLFILARLAALFAPMSVCAGMTLCIGRKPA